MMRGSLPKPEAEDHSGTSASIGVVHEEQDIGRHHLLDEGIA